ncbi:uncharacterized protein LOC106069079 [Biomphalaria glabrata]|uniref:Uncharacterized protein LOC106069079 n=1 Tax=Biomphalaria glabrata TaxID=6526 RepID=A0A9W3A660_BIOGL|nr:uncharacterized protein LOC106069079 [Biomphalaria glabrata]
MNLVVDVEDREIYRNVSNLYNFPFLDSENYSERTWEDNINESMWSLSIRNLNEFQNIHSRENQLDNKLSVAHNVNSSNLVHQESDTNVAAAPAVMPLSDYNLCPDNVITHSSSTQGDLVGDPSSGFTISNTVSTVPDLSSVVSSITLEIASTRIFSSNSEESPSLLSYATTPVDPFYRPTFVTATSTVITAQSESTVSTNCASERNLISTTISSAAETQTSASGLKQISLTAVGQISSTAATEISSTAATEISSTAVAQTVSETSQNSTKGNAGGPTYSELGIVTEHPKRFEYAMLLKRMETFTAWPRDHHLTPKKLAKAGFYYAGYGDCVRCFYCGGGLRNWEDEDDVWVEHARWFPKCAYILRRMGQVFVDTVQELNESYDHINFSMVVEKMGNAVQASQFDTKDTPLKRDPAVKTVVDMGFPYAEVIAAAEKIKQSENTLSADILYEKLVSDNINRVPNASRMFDLKLAKMKSESSSRAEEKLRALKETNEQLRQQTVCKICMDKEVAVVFLPCGHLVSCTDCAAAMKDCPVCRKHVKGTVRAFMS